MGKKASHKKTVSKKTSTKKSKILSKFPVIHLTLKATILTAIIWGVISYVDQKGYFNPNQKNNHTKTKWDSYYSFTEDNNVDVLLLGNSHLYSGINPKNLSATLGLNAFILASPGTNMADTYYSLKEALKLSSPGLVVVETYGINDFNPYQLDKGHLSDQFKSFYARKDLTTKITSTPFLFSAENYLYAWSNTLRNHDFIFKDSLQLTKNKELIKNGPVENKKLNLGRFVRFNTGIEKDILKKYDSLGAPVDGSAYSYSSYAAHYVDQIVELCNKQEIPLLFLTLPMYHKHVSNYTSWKTTLGSMLEKYPNSWLNMQSPFDTTAFLPLCFENTYKQNQHMSYSGSLIATYKLADYIKNNMKLSLINRSNELYWKQVFYGQEGYFENYPVLKNDKVNQLMCTDFKTNNVLLEEVSIIKPEKGANKIIIAKIKKSKEDITKCKLRLLATFKQDNQLKATYIDYLQYDILHELDEMNIFKAMIKPLDFQEIKAGLLFCGEDLDKAIAASNKAAAKKNNQ